MRRQALFWPPDEPSSFRKPFFNEEDLTQVDFQPPAPLPHHHKKMYHMHVSWSKM